MHVILANKVEVEYYGDIIEKALEHHEELGPPVHAFDSLANQVQQENDDDDTVLQELYPAYASLIQTF